MPLHSARPTLFNITRISHVAIDVADLAQSRRFYEEFVGLVVTDAAGDAVYLRGIEEVSHHSLTLRHSADPAAGRIGFRVSADSDLDALYDFWMGQGLPAEFVDLPHQGRTLQASDPNGVPVEFIVTMVRTNTRRAVLDYVHQRGAAPANFDHLQVHVPDVDLATDFWAGLGFYTSEAITETGDPDEPLLATFMGRKGNANDIVFLQNRGPRLHHFSYVVHNPSYALLHMCDTAQTFGFKSHIEWGPNRHSVGTEQTMYVRDPDGARIEVLSHPYHFDADEPTLVWSTKDPWSTANMWGEGPPLRWWEEAIPFRGIPVTVPTGGARVRELLSSVVVR
jgi:catechol 2,3-dioxygenase